MAVEAVALSSRLQLRLLEGYDDDGRPVLRTRSYSNLKTDAANEDVYQVAQNMAGLQVLTLENIRRVDEVDLIEVEV